ncbi:MAG TPA: hypothetical protein VIG62_07060 [Blastocatellia bacterium]|jgi:hypothetical protein
MRESLVIVVFASLLFYCNVVPVALAHQNPLPARGVPLARGCRTPKFRTLSRYRGENWSSVFRDKAIAPALRNLLKEDYRKLPGNLQRVEYPDNLSLVDSNGVLKLAGGIPGLYTISEAILIIEPCGSIYVTILEGGERFLYYTNDREHAGDLTPAIQEWISDVERRRSSNGEKAKLPIVFKYR